VPKRQFTLASLQDALWVDHDFFYWFWSASPCASWTAQAFQVDESRLVTDLMVGFRKATRPSVVGTYHRDTYSYSLLQASSGGVTVWIPLSNVDPVRQGGSIHLINRSLDAGPCAWPDSSGSTPACQAYLDAVAVLPAWRVGDVLLFDKATLHRTQPFHPNATVPSRFALVGRFAPGAPLVDAEIPRASLRLKMAYCPHNLSHHSALAHPCFPRMHPFLLASERERRATGQLGMPSNDAWFMMEGRRLAWHGVNRLFKWSDGLN